MNNTRKHEQKIAGGTPVMAAIAFAAMTFVLGVSSTQASPETVGRVSDLQGSAERDAGAGGTSLTIGSKIFQGDVVKTSQSGTLTLLMNDESLLSLGPQSSLNFKRYQVAQRRRQVSLNLFFGRVWARVTKTFGTDTNFQVTTNNAVAGVRGTEFVVQAEGGHTAIAVREGLVRMDAGKGHAMLGAGRMGELAVGGGIRVSDIRPEAFADLMQGMRPAIKLDDSDSDRRIEKSHRHMGTTPRHQEDQSDTSRGDTKGGMNSGDGDGGKKPEGRGPSPSSDESSSTAIPPTGATRETNPVKPPVTSATTPPTTTSIPPVGVNPNTTVRNFFTGGSTGTSTTTTTTTGSTSAPPVINLVPGSVTSPVHLRVNVLP